MAYDIGPRIGIDGEAEFRRAIQNINTNVRTLGTEMLAVTSAYDANDRSAAALTARNQVLVKQIDAQKEKLSKLQEGLAASADKYGESDEKTQRWQQTVNRATAELNSMERQLAANTQELDKQGGSVDGLKEKMGAFGSGLASAAKAAAAGLAAVTAAAGAMVGAVVKGVSSVAEYGDNIDKMSQKLGMSAETYQEWDFIMQHCGTSIESMQSSMKTLASAAEKGNAAFDRLGISQEELAGMSQEDLFSATIAALQNVSDETERTYLAGQLLGRGATELGPLLNTSAQDVEAMRRQVHELGGVMSNESVAAAATFQDSLQNLQTAMSGLSRGALADFLPAMTQIMDGLTGLLSGDASGLDLISQGLDDFVASLSATLPQLLETGRQIVESLLGAIVENLPRLIESGANVLMEFSAGILGMLPELAAAALEVVSTLASGISDSLPELIPAVVDTVLQIVETLTDPEILENIVGAALEIILALAEGLIEALPKLLEKAPVIIENLVNAIAGNLPKILQAGIELIVKLAEGVIQSIPALVGAVPEVIGALLAGFANYYKSLLDMGKNLAGKVGEGIKNIGASAAQWGRDLIDNFVSGIKNAIGKVKDAVSNVADTVKSFLGFSEPEEGPLSNFHTYAPDMMQLFARGITDNAGLLRRAFDKSLTFARDALKAYDPEIDYSALMLAAKDLDEFQELAAKRAAKIVGENINLTEKGWADNASLMEQWKALAEKAAKNTEETVTQLVKGTAGELADWVNNASEHGADFIGNVLDGLASREDSLYRAMASVGERAADAFRTGLEGAFELKYVQRELAGSMAELAGNASGHIQVSGSAAGPSGGDAGNALAQLPALIAAAVHAEFEGMAVNLNLRKVGELTSRWQANQVRAMGV